MSDYCIGVLLRKLHERADIHVLRDGSVTIVSDTYPEGFSTGPGEIGHQLAAAACAQRTPREVADE